jgi:hypothetical protein
VKIDSKIQKLLNISKAEALILKTLTSSSQTATNIQIKTNIPRTTLDRLLLGLHERGFIGKRKHSAKQGGWVDKSFESIFEESGLYFYKNNFDKNELLNTSEHVGKNTMLKIAEDFLVKNKNKKIYGLQSKKVWESWYKTLGKTEVDRFDKIISKNKVVMDIVFTNDADFKLIAGHYTDRPSLSHVIDKKFLDNDFDIEVSENEILMMNWSALKCIHIKNRNLAKAFIGIFEFIKEKAEYKNIHQ